jgi:hypothetical protein
MALIQFTKNHADHSTDRGFQFEFFCDKCGNGYMTRFQTAPGGVLTDALDVASGLFGGLLGNAADAAHRVHSAGWQKAWDDAFNKAVEEAKPHFKQCKRCGKWVCQEICWNDERGLCKDCAPDLEEEYAVAQEEAAVDQARQVAREATYVTKEKFEKKVVGTCPHCGAKLTGGKFCPECGKPVSAEKHCTECGEKMPASAKFCPSCGAKQG